MPCHAATLLLLAVKAPFQRTAIDHTGNRVRRRARYAVYARLLRFAQNAPLFS